MGYHKKNYLNIVQFTKKLLSTNLYDSKEKENLRKRIEEEEVLTEKKWLLERLKKMQ